jgi:PAS domain S-box-containing protein
MAQTAHRVGGIPGLMGRIEGVRRDPRSGTPDPHFARTRRAILWLAASILLVVVGGVTFSSVQSYREEVANAQHEALTIARAIEPYIARIITRTGNYLERVRPEIEAGGGPAAMQPARIEALLATRPQDDLSGRHVLVSDSDGRVVTIAGARPDLVGTIRHREFFRFHSSNPDRRPRVSAPFPSVIDGRWRLPVSVRLENPDGSFAGVLNTAVEVEGLSGYFASLGLRERTIAHLIGETGDSLARHPAVPGGVERARLARTMSLIVQGDEGTFRTESPVSGEDHIGGYRRLVGMPIYALVATTADAALASWRRGTVERILAGAGGLLVTGLLLMLLLRRLQTERAATENLAKFRRAIDLSGDLIYWVDSDGNLVYLNDAAARRLGVDPKRPGALHIRDVSARYSEMRWRQMSEDLMAAGEASYQSEHKARDGGAYPVQVAATHLVVGGRDLGFLICRDLSDSMRQQREIEALNESLEKRVEARTAELANANEELESFAYSVSHDLRAPLNHLKAYAGELAQGCVDGPEGKRLARRIVERSEYMGELIDDLLALSRVARAPLQVRDLDLSTMAAEIDREHRILEPARTMETIIASDLVARADPVLLRTLLDNLIGNAWKYSSKVPHALIEIFAEEQQGKTVFAVRDNGAGFDARYAERLFKPFQRLHNQSEFPGTGVGLATARRIVARHGGRIWAQSLPGEGATFRFTLE